MRLALPAALLACLLTLAWNSNASHAFDFARDVQPLLKARCFECHGPDKQESGFRLDDPIQAMQGGDSGKSIIAGKSQESRLIRYVSGADPDHRMPPDGPQLTSDEVNLLKQWIDSGANWPEGQPVLPNATNIGPTNRLHKSFPPKFRIAQPSSIQSIDSSWLDWNPSH